MSRQVKSLYALTIWLLGFYLITKAIEVWQDISYDEGYLDASKVYRESQRLQGVHIQTERNGESSSHSSERGRLHERDSIRDTETEPTHPDIMREESKV